MATPERQSLARLAAESGVRIPCAGNLPLEMDDPQFAWYIDNGAIDLFLVERKDGVEQSAPQHLLRADAGRLVPGVAPQEGDTTFGLVAKGLPDTTLRRLPVAHLGEIRNKELADQVDAWLMDVSAMLSRDVIHQPRPDVLVEPGQTPAAQSGALSTRRGVVWVSEPPSGSSLFMSLLDPVDSKPDGEAISAGLPLTPKSWLTLMEPADLSIRSSESLAEENLLLHALANFHAVAFSLERLNRSLAVVDQANLERAQATNRRTDEEGARQRLFNLYNLAQDGEADAGESALLDVLRIIGQHEKIDFKWPTMRDTSASGIVLSDVLDASGVRARQVRLSPEDKWWVGDSGPMLAFREDVNRPVALLPGVLGHYWEVDPIGGRKTKVTARRAASLSARAWTFYQPLTSAGAGPRDLFRLARNRITADFIRFIATGLLVGLVMLLPAVVLGFIADEVIPTGEAGLLYSVTAVLASFALVGALLHVLQGMALIRLEGRVVSRIEAAFWDRMIQLPSNFLHRYSAGDLAMRGMTLQKLRDEVQGMVANDVLSFVFLSPGLILIFFYDATLGGIVASFGILSLLLTVALGLRQIAPHRRVTRAVQGLTGRLYQLINGISKLRIARAEGSAFAVWARDYCEKKHAELELGAREAHLQAFGAALPFLAGAVLLLAITLSDRDSLSVGDFLVVYTVFIVFQTAVARLGASFSSVAAIMPAFDQVRPFLAEAPETSVDGEPVGTLGGEILLDHVSFRYDSDGPLILDDVSIHARPGEFVAIAGESGSGKSTVFRLALGLEQPSAGSVYYDGRDLRHLNIKQVRRQIGAVPQAVQLHPQDLWDNIVGGYEDASAEDAWEATRTAAVDREIAAMPMQMLTNVGAGASLTSGGESQRIMIAHSLIRKPRILLLDEATNWLDNDSQSRIMANLERLSSTRIVIAHRLSTLRQADRIFVMQKGRVVQAGSFSDLVATEGVFQDLVRRQMAA